MSRGDETFLAQGDMLEVVLGLADVELSAPDVIISASGGPGYIVVDLLESQDFWIDEERDRIEPILREYELERDRLAREAAATWGEPSLVSLGPIFDRVLAGGEVSMLAEALSMFAVEVLIWRLPDRVVCVGVGHEDKELPIVLFTAAGTEWTDDAEPVIKPVRLGPYRQLARP